LPYHSILITIDLVSFETVPGRAQAGRSLARKKRGEIYSVEKKKSRVGLQVSRPFINAAGALPGELPPGAWVTRTANATDGFTVAFACCLFGYGHGLS
jgi:hypothetical protein